MLVYGDHSQEVAPRDCLAELAAEDGRFHSHETLRSRFITLSGLAQGVADEDFRAFGADRERPAERELLDALVDHGALLMQSWDEGCRGAVPPGMRIAASGLPQQVSVRLPEGYAFYALYPEAYGLAARKLRLEGQVHVIGLRSIGSGLAAVAAAALGTRRITTLRPCGHPFARRLSIDDELAAAFTADASYVIVDEGPGLSGSSFGCVADWLEQRGVPRERIAFLPGHEGDLGVQASAEHRKRWKSAQRPVAKIDCLRNWVEEIVGPALRWDDLSRGAWRSLWSASESEWPAVTPDWERAKYLAWTDRGEWLVRFAGLGRTGAEKLALARLLARTGFGPEVAGLAHGWLILRWHPDARPACPTLDELAAYLRLRALLPAPQGASLPELVAMVRRNAPGWSGWDPPVHRLQHRVRPVRIDGRMQRHEWLRLSCGRLVKADALDHFRSHDLVGCQDIAWDVAAAALELDLPHADVRRLEQALGADPDLTAFYRIAYAAFRYGAHIMSAQMADEAEAERHRKAAGRYASALVDAVEHPGHLDEALALGIEALP